MYNLIWVTYFWAIERIDTPLWRRFHAGMAPVCHRIGIGLAPARCRIGASFAPITPVLSNLREAGAKKT